MEAMSRILNKWTLARLRKTSMRMFYDTGYDIPDQLMYYETEQYHEKPDTKKADRARSIKVVQHFKNEPHLNDMREYIPSKYFSPKRRLTLEHLYLADSEIAKSVTMHMLPFIQGNKAQIVCETNAGLGLIAAELLRNGVKMMRLYETCPEFRLILKGFSNVYPDRVEVFTKDIFHLSTMSNIDRYDHGGRVQQLLKGVPKRKWSDDPVMTIVGPMPCLRFIKYLMRMLTLQQEIFTYGRIQIFALMRPMDYFKFTAGPGMSLHVYQVLSVLFQLFFDCEFLEKYPRKSFLPWETKLKITPHTQYHSKTDLDYMYLVRINQKKVLPTEIQHLLHLYYFIKQGFLKGRTKVIPTVEKWLPGVGIKLIVPKDGFRSKCFPNMSIYTEFGHLSPEQLLQVFLEMLKYPGYQNSPFTAVAETELLQNETIESSLADSKVNQSVTVENLKENIS